MKLIGNGLNGNIGRVFIQKSQIINYDEQLNLNADVFLHLASKRFGNSSEYINSNILYLKQCINYCIRNNIKKFVFFSAISVYGDINTSLINEDTPFDNPDLYGLSKIFGEKILEESNLSILILRLPMVLTYDNTIGILNRLRNQIIKNSDIFITNYDKKFNNFILATDILNFILNYNFEKKYNIFSIGNQLSHSLLDITEIIKTYYDSKSKIIKDSSKTNFFNIDIKKQIEYNFKITDVEESLKVWLNEFN